nr:hypothetical protein MtrunA17_Chr7g0233391 [Ipomoea batatas]
MRGKKRATSYIKQVGKYKAQCWTPAGRTRLPCARLSLEAERSRNRENLDSLNSARVLFQLHSSSLTLKFLSAFPNSKKMMNVGNIFSSPLSSMFGSPPPSPKGLPRAEMMVPRHTHERGEPSRRPNEDTSSEEGEAPVMEVAHRGLMIEMEDLFRYRHFRDKQIIEWNYIEAPVLAVLGIQREFERMTSHPFWSHICGWRDATYVPIVREFIATLEVNERVHNRRQPSIRFKLFNRQYNLSSDELGNLLGFYTLHDQDQGWYANLVDDFPNEHQPELFWWSIARQGVAWIPSYTSAKYIKVPELKIMWHIIARSWLGRQSPNDNVTTPEEPSEDDERGEQRDLWGIIERLENRVNMLEHEVRRLKLERVREESDGSSI